MADSSFRLAIDGYYSESQIARIRSTVIGIAGAGGLGSNCAVNLVRSGFERFVLADFDSVEPSNLNRQAYLPSDVGRCKCECLARLLLAINPACSITTHAIRVTSENVHALFDPCEVVVEAFDRAEAKAMIVAAFLNSNRFLVSASGLAGIGNSDAIVTRRVRENFVLIGDGFSEAGVDMRPYAPRVSIAAAKQADAVLEWVLRKGLSRV